MTKPLKELGRYGAVGIELVLGLLILAGVGHWLDTRYWAGRGYGTAIGFLLGVAVGVRNLVGVAKRMQSDIEKAEAEDPEASRWTVDESWLNKRDSHPPERKDSDDRPR